MVSGPVLIEFGVPPVAAHLFVFYLAILSAVTPPVCGAIFIAAGMADANWLETAKFGLKLCFAAFLIPFRGGPVSNVGLSSEHEREEKGKSEAKKRCRVEGSRPGFRDGGRRRRHSW